jgi:C1A family cysteine protease
LSLQGECGSCWAFSATGAIEGAWFLKHNRAFNLSEQQLMDCSGPEGDESCNGGLMDDAFQFVIDNKGIATEECYPYQALDQASCNQTCKSVASIASFKDVPFNESNANDDVPLMVAIQFGPVSVAIEADQPVFQSYTGGVINDTSCGIQLDHGVLLVGYGNDAKYGSFWTIKNSWGEEWGEKGFGRIARTQNMCGINTEASYVMV